MDHSGSEAVRNDDSRRRGSAGLLGRSTGLGNRAVVEVQDQPCSRVPQTFPVLIAAPHPDRTVPTVVTSPKPETLQRQQENVLSLSGDYSVLAEYTDPKQRLAVSTVTSLATPTHIPEADIRRSAGLGVRLRATDKPVVRACQRRSRDKGDDGVPQRWDV